MFFSHLKTEKNSEVDRSHTHTYTQTGGGPDLPAAHGLPTTGLEASPRWQVANLLETSLPHQASPFPGLLRFGLRVTGPLSDQPWAVCAECGQRQNVSSTGLSERSPRRARDLGQGEKESKLLA